MAEKKKGAPELTEAQKEKARAQLQRQKEKAAKKSERQEAKAAKDQERYEKRVAAERKRAVEARAQEAAKAADPQYQAKKAAELERQKEKGRREMEKARKRSAKKAAAAAKSREKEAEKAAKAQAKGGLSAAAAPAGAKAERRPKRKRTNLIAIVVICVIALAAAVMLYPPQDKITQGLDIQGGVSVNLSASTLDGSAVTQEQMDEAQSVITSRVNASGASAASVQQQGSTSFLVQVPGAEDAQSIIDTLSTTGVLEFVRVDAIEDDEIVQLIESGITGMNLKDEGVAYTTFMSGENVTNVTVDRPEGSSDYAVNLTLDSQGTKDFGTVTSELVSTNGQIAILLDGKVECAPAVQSAITTGQVQITGNYTAQEANDLKAIINSGSLPVSLTIDQSSIVGPTLGQNALWVGIVSALIGLALVMLYLLVFYHGLGSSSSTAAWASSPASPSASWQSSTWVCWHCSRASAGSASPCPASPASSSTSASRQTPRS